MAGNNSPDKDDVLNRYLEGKSGVSEQYREAASETPPQRLDRAILSASRKAIRTGKHIAFSPFASDWHIPVSLAAVLILSVALVVIIRNESSLPPIEEPLQQRRSQAQENLQNGKDAGDTAAKSMASAAAAGSAADDTTGGGRNGADRDSGKAGGGSAKSAAAQPAELNAPIRRRVEPKILQEPVKINSVAAEPEAAVAANAEQKGGVQFGFPRQFIKYLTGSWSGTAVTTPVGPAAYDITFETTPGACISGTAHPGTHHTWTFCLGSQGLTLDFLSDFQGNRTPIHFRQLAYNDGVYTFKAPTHDFMEVLVFAGETSAWMKVFHYGKLHVEIRLTRK